MSMLLLDTTFLVGAERRGLELDVAIGDDDDIAIAAITVAELLVGVKLASGRRRAARQAYVDDVIESLPVIAMTPVSSSNTPSFSPQSERRAVRGEHTTYSSPPPPEPPTEWL